MPMSVVMPVMCVVRTTALESLVTSAFCSPMAAQMSAVISRLLMCARCSEPTLTVAKTKSMAASARSARQ